MQLRDTFVVHEGILKIVCYCHNGTYCPNNNYHRNNKYLMYFQRKANYTDGELELLVHLVESHKLQLYGSFSSLASQGGQGTTNKDKQGVWNTIATKMDGTGLVKRTPGELKRKKETWFSEVKKKVCHSLVKLL